MPKIFLGSLPLEFLILVLCLDPTDAIQRQRVRIPALDPKFKLPFSQGRKVCRQWYKILSCNTIAALSRDTLRFLGLGVKNAD